MTTEIFIMKEQLVELMVKCHELNMAIINKKVCELDIMVEKDKDADTKYAVALAKVSLEEVRGDMINTLSDTLAQLNK